jgi:hypothetical protein
MTSQHAWAQQSEHGSVALCYFKKKKARQPIQIGKRETSDAVDFVANIPDGWRHGNRGRATMKIPNVFGPDGRPIRFRHQMNIWHPKCKVEFTVYFDSEFWNVVIFADVSRLSKTVTSFMGMTFEWKDAEHVEIRLPHHDEDWGAQHPLVELFHRAETHQQMHVIRPGLARMFPKSIVDDWHLTLMQRAADKNIRGELEALCEGFTKFYTLAGDDYGLLRLGRKGEGDQLFGLSWIFPWAAHVVKYLGPNCLELDGTFESMKPYTLEIIEAIVANESIPIGLAIFPTETAKSYHRLHTHLAEVLGPGGEELLQRIPILSDMGAQLGKFTRKKWLRWLICHRHLLQSVGASSIGGDWFRRLLDAGDLAEAKQVVDAIEIEQEALGRRGKILFRRDSHRQHLKAMMDAVRSNDVNQLAGWARWMRLGCPTTTNAAESIHARLNELCRHSQSFFHSLSIVKEYLWRRFNKRNSEKRVARRAVNKWCSQKQLAKMTPGNCIFYHRLHTFGWCRWFTGFNWLFPDMPDAVPGQSNDVWPCGTPDWLSAGPKETPPEGWRDTRKTITVPATEGADPVQQKVEFETPDGASEVALRKGRQIFRTTKIISGCRKKDYQERQRLAKAVWDHGERLNLITKEAIGADQEAEWRVAVLEALGLLPKKDRNDGQSDQNAATA